MTSFCGVAGRPSVACRSVGTLLSRKHYRILVRDIDDPHISSRSCPADCNSGPFTPRTIFTRFSQYIFYLVFVNSMTINMRHSSLWIDVEPNVHADSHTFSRRNHRQTAIPGLWL